MTSKRSVPDAWVGLPGDDVVRAHTPAGTTHPYDFGFVANMSRLLLAHGDIGPAFRTLFRQIMFEPGELTRREREMVAAVAAAAQDCHY